MERAKTNGPIRGISRRSVRSVRPETEETPGTEETEETVGTEAGAAVARAGPEKEKRPATRPDVSVQFAVIERLLAESEAS
ncbi:hypothetical protein K320107C7_10190 [Alistipes shahii]